MAFFDKLSEMAKNIGDKTNDAIETTKLNSKINGEKKAIEAEMSKLGACVYAMHTAGSPFEGEAAEICSVIDEHNRAIAEIQAEIERIKAEAEAAQAARAAASAKAASQAAQAAVQASDAAQAAAQAATGAGRAPPTPLLRTPAGPAFLLRQCARRRQVLPRVRDQDARTGPRPLLPEVRREAERYR